jgi:hypothetical protein
MAALAPLVPLAAAAIVAAVSPPDRVISFQGEAVGLLEGRQRCRRVDEFRRGRELHRAAACDVFSEIAQGNKLVFVGDVLAQRDRPGVVGRRRGQPDDLVGIVIQRFCLFISLGGIVPAAISTLFEEEGSVAGIFGINIDLAGGDRLAYDRGGAELDAIGRLDAIGVQHRQDDIAEHPAFGIDLGRYHNLRLGGAKREGGGKKDAG